MSTAGRLVRVRRNVRDLTRSIAFHCDVLGFAVAQVADEPSSAILRLGEQELELVQAGADARPCPADSRSCDLWFQHLAIVVGDMATAFAHLDRHDFVPITREGPQRLPPESGAVTAYKFRDPDGHPLELIHFPPGTGDPLWQHQRGTFRGIDHSAIVVSDVNRSIDFYGALGLTAVSGSTNTGPEQARLDDLPADVRVQVVALQPPDVCTPHVELLGYTQPRGRPMPRDIRPTDTIADCLVFVPDGKVANAQEEAREAAASRAPPSTAQTRDPDGHRLTWLATRERAA